MPRNNSRSNSPTFNSHKSFPIYKPPTSLPVHKPLTPLPLYKAPTLVDTIKQGFGFGLGSAVAHRAVDSFMGSRTVDSLNSPKESQKIYTPCIEKKCDIIEKEFEKCNINLNCSDELVKEYNNCLKQ
jgi:hypothetical protein